MFQVNEVLLSNLLQQVESGAMQLPDFQRGWVWDDGRICGLLASISKGFPVGAIMTLSAAADIRFQTRPIEGVELNGVDPKMFLLDGQQRLTSLYQAMLHPGPVDTKDSRGKKIRRWYYVDMLKAMDEAIDREDAIFSSPEDRKTTRDFGRETVLDLSRPEFEYRNHMMPTERLLDSQRWMLEYIKFWNDSSAEHPKHDATDFFIEFTDSVLSAFVNYQLPVINLTQNTPKEAVCTVFEKVNTGGVVLTVFELVTASFAAEDFALRDDWSVRKARISEYSGTLQGVTADQFLQTVALLATQDRHRKAMEMGASATSAPGIGCRRRDILNLSLEEYLSWADKVEEGFRAAARFLLQQAVFRKDNVPYGTQLVPLAALHVELEGELNNADAIGKLERWYWSGVFGESYGGSTETQFALDLTEVASFVRGSSEVPALVSEANFVPERLLSLRTRNSAAYKGLYALQMKKGAADWLTGQSLSVQDWTSHDSIDIHHIFPKSWCERSTPKIPPRIYNSVINKTPIDAVTNRKIGGRSPSSYLSALKSGISEEMLDQVLRAHWIDPDHLGSDSFAEFFEERGEAMLDLIGQAMGKSIGSGREVFKNALFDAGFVEEYEDEEDEPDPVGTIANDQVAD